VWRHYFLHGDGPEDRVTEDVLVRKTEVIRQELGSLSPLVQRQVEEALEGGIDLERARCWCSGQLEGMDAAAQRARRAAAAQAQEELEASRPAAELEQQQDALRPPAGEVARAVAGLRARPASSARR
jgi:hypothetical protein